jgi:membrane-bound ClpP family serine protease
MSPYLLLLIGLLLILLEFYLPGAVMGIAGVCIIIASIVLFAMEGESALATALFVFLAIASIAAVVKFALWQIRRTGKNKTIFLDDDQEGFQASSYDEVAIGKKGVALSDLKPSGFVFVDGKQRQAVSRAEYIVKGSDIEVIGGQGACLIVKRINKEKENHGVHDTTGG